jgi:hypothetical protein
MDEGSENLVSSSPCGFKRFLTCRKVLRLGTSGFTSHPKEGVLLIFVALNPSPWPGWNPRPLGPVASTLTTTPPMRLAWSLTLWSECTLQLFGFREVRLIFGPKNDEINLLEYKELRDLYRSPRCLFLGR